MSQMIIKKFVAEECKFIGGNFFHTSLKGVDFSTCEIDGLVVSDSMTELRGCVINQFQAPQIAQMCGLVVK